MVAPLEPQSHWEPNGTVALETKTAGVWDNLIIDASNSNPAYGSSQTVMPASIDVPCIIYLVFRLEFFMLMNAFPSLDGRQYRRGNKPGWFACFDWGGFMDKRRWW